MLRSLALISVAVLCSPPMSIGQNAQTTQADQKSQANPAVAVRYQPEPAPAEIQRKLDQAIGRPVYACHRTGLILLDTKKQDGKPMIYYGAPVNPDLPGYMSPWKVVGIDQLNEVAGWSFFGLRILVNGAVMVVNGIAVSPSELQFSPDLLQTLAGKARLFTSVEASGIHFTDLHAVQTGEIHSGMSEQEVECALGPPPQSEPGNTGQIKDVYDGGRLVISLAGGRVVNVQHLSLQQPEERAAK